MQTEKTEERQMTKGTMANIPETTKAAIETVLEYLWDDELVNFVAEAEANRAAANDGHVFASLCAMRSYIEGRKHDPGFYLAKAWDPETTEKTGLVVDRVRNLVFDAENQECVAELLQTSVGLIRNDTGTVIEAEVIHLCKGVDGEEFCIDGSFEY